MAVSKPLTPRDIAAAVEPHFASAVEAGQAVGLAFGVVHNGELIAQGGFGTRTPDGTSGTPDAASVFRIASMTKSFTAATVLSLRDDGLLALDDPVHRYVPELLAGGRSARSISIRHLLTMGGGFLTDDPWGDRQQDLPVEAFRALLASGVAPALVPGEQFEYSNLGYAVLGLALEAVTSMPFADLVEMRLLAPLGLSSTGFEPRPGADVVPGFVRRSVGWVEEPAAPHGAFSPMGGLFSSVADLARWVGVLQSASIDGAQPADDLLSAGARREMQRTQRLVAATTGGTASGTASGTPGATSAPVVTGYGFGLFEEFGPAGRSVFHSGGYPGYGSHMRWHPASGLGIVALANVTYAPMSTVAARALRELVETAGVPLHAPGPTPTGLERAKEVVLAWMFADAPDGAESGALRDLCADNVELDVPWDERCREWARAHDGGELNLKGEQATSPGAVRLELGDDITRWHLTVMMAPHDTSLIQSIAFRPVAPDAPEPPVSTVIS